MVVKLVAERVERRHILAEICVALNGNSERFALDRFTSAIREDLTLNGGAQSLAEVTPNVRLPALPHGKNDALGFLWTGCVARW